MILINDIPLNVSRGSIKIGVASNARLSRVNDSSAVNSRKLRSFRFEVFDLPTEDGRSIFNLLNGRTELITGQLVTQPQYPSKMHAVAGNRGTALSPAGTGVLSNLNVIINGEHPIAVEVDDFIYPDGTTILANFSGNWAFSWWYRRDMGAGASIKSNYDHWHYSSDGKVYKNGKIDTASTSFEILNGNIRIKESDTFFQKFFADLQIFRFIPSYLVWYSMYSRSNKKKRTPLPFNVLTIDGEEIICSTASSSFSLYSAGDAWLCRFDVSAQEVIL